MGRAAILEHSHCLQYIDPYGNATFNQLQLPQLIRELEQATAQIAGTSLKEQAAKVVEFLRGCDGIHTYVKFIGD